MPIRYGKPNFLLHVATNLQSNNSNKTRLSQLQGVLKNVKIDKDKANKVIKDLIKDGILIQENKNTDVLRLAREDEIKTYNQDLYCFECFLPGELVKCRNCTRTFHADCTRRYADRPNYIIPPSNEIAEYKDEEMTDIPPSNSNVHTDSSNIESNEYSLEPKIKRCRVVVQRFPMISTNATQEIDLTIEPENKNNIEMPDVVCLGEIRPPTRQRNITESSLNSTMKFDLDAELTNEEQILIEKEYCTCCRLLKEGEIYQPPNLEATEICHLLQQSFERHRSWMKYDIFKQFETWKLTKKTISIVIEFLFQNRPMMTLESIEEKIRYNQYQQLNEILCDALEFQYALGVLFGSNSLDFDCSKYLLRELTYDIKEIRRCPDCFRHSSDRITQFWFALPCIQRHELVFAKCKGFSYWPAKVVRVLKKADKYDVRFFGGNHERSVVNKHFVRPIDVMDFPKPKSILFNKAMNELKCYQALQSYSADKFKFNSINVQEIDAIIKTVMSAIDVNFKVDTLALKKRRKTLNLSDISNISTLALFNIEENSSSNLEPQSLNSTPTPRTNRESNKRLKRNELNTNNSPTLLFELPTIEQKYEDLKRQLEMERENSQRQLELHKHEILIAKRKSYCFKCLEPAKFLCCINASYCSKLCQRAHWNEGHDKQCSHREGN